MINRIKLACCALIATALAVFAACATNSESGRRQFIIVPESQMDAMGAQSFLEMKEQTPISHDSAMAAKIVEIGKRIAAATGKDYDWEFTLFDSKEVNAFCLPGGKVGVYTGILPIAQTNAGLAAVMGHEVAHAILRHGAERVSQQLAVAGATLALDTALGDSAKKPYIMGAIGLGAQFGVLLPYSRTQESEADTVGLEYMAKAGYDPSAAVSLWERMAQQGGAKPPEFMSTHPDSLERAKALAKQQESARRLWEESNKVATAPL